MLVCPIIRKFISTWAITEILNKNYINFTEKLAIVKKYLTMPFNHFGTFP
jgi:hypothetical protein